MDKAVTEKLRIDDAGGGPVVVYLRSGGAPSKAGALLAREFRVLTVDTGQAAPSALDAAIREHGAEKFCMVAHAQTAHEALAFALAYPDKVEAMVLLAPPALDDGTMSKLASGLSGLKVPVMVLLGTRDQDSPPAIGAAFKRALPNGHMTFVYDATAAMDTERPEAVAAALKQFLAERERFLVAKESSVLYP